MEAADLRVGARPVEQLLLGTALNYRIGAVYGTIVFPRGAREAPILPILGRWCARPEISVEAADLRVGARLVEPKPSESGLNRRVGAVYCTFIFTRAAGWGGAGGRPKFGNRASRIEY